MWAFALDVFDKEEEGFELFSFDVDAPPQTAAQTPAPTAAQTTSPTVASTN